ncbi:hypothetical protein [Lentzea sp. NPDC051838]|uniref:hypothetical protein n=1 Tax=Lentzea sp. NPDC051838 TaxID=3154849 RepID=UPI00341A3C45
MKRLVVAALVAGAAMSVATPAQAAPTATLQLWSSWQAANFVVNGKTVVVDSGYDMTTVQVPQGKVSLVAPAKVDIGARQCGNFDSWADGSRTRSRSVEVGSGGASFIAYYGSGSC